MAVLAPGGAPELETDLCRALAPLESALGQELTVRARPTTEGGLVEVWAWNERVAAAFTGEAGLAAAVRDVGARLETAARSGLVHDRLDVLEHVSRARRFTPAGFADGGVVHFCYRLTRAEACARLSLTGRRGLMFLDQETEENAVLVRLDDLGPGETALALESVLHMEDFDRRGENTFELEVLDATGRTVHRRPDVRLTVFPALPSLEEGLREALKHDFGVALGRDPTTGTAFVAHRRSAVRIDVHDYVFHTRDVDLSLVEGFPPLPDDSERRPAWRDALRCIECGRDLAWDDAELACSCGARFPVRGGVPHFLGAAAAPAPHGEELWDANPVPKALLYFVLKYPDGIVIDCGAGNGEFRAPNLVNLEVFPFENIDVVADGQRLPFRDDSVDAILSAAVLEHVPDPFAYCAELRRVLKTGGEARIDSAFMTPYHACPDHYFNTTASGLAAAARGLEPVGLGAGPHQSPFVAMQIWLTDYVRHLPSPEHVEHFMQTTVRELLEAPHGAGPSSIRIHPSRAADLAAGIYLHGFKS